MSRLDRVSSEIRHNICDIIQKELKDPRLGFITITAVAVSADLHVAKVYFTALGDRAKKQASHQALKNAAGFIRKELASRMNMCYTPVLDFRFDESVEYGQKIDEIFRKIDDERKKDAS